MRADVSMAIPTSPPGNRGIHWVMCFPISSRKCRVGASHFHLPWIDACPFKAYDKDPHQPTLSMDSGRTGCLYEVQNCQLPRAPPELFFRDMSNVRLGAVLSQNIPKEECPIFFSWVGTKVCSHWKRGLGCEVDYWSLLVVRMRRSFRVVTALAATDEQHDLPPYQVLLCSWTV